MINDLVRAHHADYSEDLPYWISRTSGWDIVIELGSGHGRVSLPLCDVGRKVICLDLFLDPLLDLKSSARDSNISGYLPVMANMLELPFIGEVGAIIIPCNTYSMFTHQERQQLLSQVLNLISQKGIFIASVPNPQSLQKLNQELFQEESERDPVLEAVFDHPLSGNPVQVSSRLCPGENYIRWDWIYDHLLPDGSQERYVKEAIHQLCSVGQYQSEFLQAGFDDLNFLGNFERDPYRDDSEYLIMECRRS